MELENSFRRTLLVGRYRFELVSLLPGNEEVELYRLLPLFFDVMAKE